MKNNFKRCLALLLALMTIVGAFAIPVSAAEICNHDNREVVITKEADCDESGYTTYRCKDCGEYWTEDIVLPLGHKWETKATSKPASCAAPGYKAGAEVCAVCNAVKNPADELGKTQGHVWDLTQTEKTNGRLCDPVLVKDKNNNMVQNYVTITKYCTVCKKDIVIHKTPTIGHAPEVYEYEVTYPTCAQAGVSIKKCKYCGDASAINVAKYEHDVTGWTKVKSFDGKKWDDAEGKLVDAGVAINDSTCVEVKKCKTCGYVLEVRATAAHTAGTVKSKADACGYPGYNTVECTGCKYVYKVTVPVQHVHSGAAKYSQPAIHTATKLQAGYSEYDCTKCNRAFKVYTDPTQEFIEEAHTIGAAHTMLEVKMNTIGYYVKPTCTENGYGRYECTDPNCAFSVLDVIPELNHIDPATGLSAWVPVRPERCDKVWYITNQCSLCQAEELVGEAQEPVDHSAKHVKTTIAATCFWEGREVVTCPDCLDADGNPVVISSTIVAPKKNHDPYTCHVPVDNGLSGCFNTRIEYLKCTACTDELKTEVKVETGRFYYDNHAFGAEKMGIVPTCHSEGEMIKECSRCHATVVTAKLPVDSSNHTGANPGTAGSEKYTTSKGSIDVVVGDLTYIHDLKDNVDPSLKGADGKHKYDCSTRYYTWWYCGGCHQELMLPSVYDDPDTADVEKYVSGEGVHCFEIDTTNGRPATCLNTGVGDMTCKACGFVVEDAVIPATGHAKGTKIPAQCVAPTCTSVGVDYFQCANGCGGVYVETVEIDENAHSYPKKSGKNVYTILVDSTCVTWGRQCQTCSRCGFQTNFSTIALKAHGVVKGWTHVAAKAATCTAAGNVEYFKCKECSATYTGYSGHYDANKNGKVDKNEDKRTTGTASDSTTQTLAENVVLTKLGHSPAAAVDHTSTDCTTYGYKSISCSRCQVELEWTDFDEPGAHTPKKKSDNKTIDVQTVKATCQRGGYTYKLCTVCKDDAGNATKFDITPVANDPIKPHVSNAKNYIVGDCRLVLGDTSCTTCKGTGTTGKTGDEYVKCPDCDSWKFYICANDADPDKKDIQACGAFVPAAHEYLLVGNYDACNASVYACKFCKDSYDVALADSTISTVNHTFVPSAESVAPTTTSEGIDAKECAICGFVTKDRIAKLTGVIFSLEAYNPNTTAIVNGGKLYVDVMMDAEAISVNNIRVSVNYDSTVLKFVGVVDGTSVFGEYTNPQSDASIDDKTKIGTAIIFDDAGSERVNVDIEGVVKFVTLEFYVEPSAYEFKGREITEVSFTNVEDFENAVTYKDVETGEAFEYGFDVEIFDEVEISIDQLGDINNDGKVNNVDFVALRNAFGGEYDAVLDINHDGEINMDDVNRMKQYMVGKYAYTDFADLDAYFARLEAEKEAANKNNK